MNGVLIIDKPAGLTSHDVVNRVRRILGQRSVGHLGTLDPLATGVLPLVTGSLTRLAQFYTTSQKSYEGVVRFGFATDTYDADGAETRRADAAGVTEARVQEALAAFRGSIRQRPPAFSALKRDGRPLYDYARRGEAVEAPERTVIVHELTLLRFAGPASVSLAVRCSKGTYIRSLAFDLGRSLGPGAHLRALRRTCSGPFALAVARPLADLIEALRGPAGALPLIPLTDALGHLPRVRAGAEATLALRQGKAVGWAALQTEAVSAPAPTGRFMVLGPAGDLLAVAQRHPDGLVRTLRVFN